MVHYVHQIAANFICLSAFCAGQEVYSQSYLSFIAENRFPALACDNLQKDGK